MDLKSLSDLFQSGNWSLVQPALDQFNSTGEQAKANVAQTQALTNKTNTMLPYDVEHSKALTEGARQQARTQQLESDAKEGVPLADRTNAYWSDLKSKMSDVQINQLNNNMEAMRYYANKPQWSLEDQTTMQSQYPGLMEQLSSPNGRKVAAQIYDDHIKHSGKYMTEEMKAKYHLQGIQAQTGAMLQSMREQIGAGKFSKPWMVGINSKIDMEHSPGKKQTMLIDAAQQVGPETPEGQVFLSRAAALDNAVLLERGQVPKPGSVDKEKVGVAVAPKPTGMPGKGSPGKLPPLPNGAVLDK